MLYDISEKKRAGASHWIIFADVGYSIPDLYYSILR